MKLPLACTVALSVFALAAATPAPESLVTENLVTENLVTENLVTENDGLTHSSTQGQPDAGLRACGLADYVHLPISAHSGRQNSKN